MMDDNEQMNDKITLEIAKKLASEGNYDEAITLLSPLIHSSFSIEALNLLGKIYAQNQDFESAGVYFKEVLQQDSNNVEAINGLKKCEELKGSKIKTYFNFNKLKVFSMIIAAILVIGIISFASFSLFSTANSNQFEGTAMVDADIMSVSIVANGDAQYLLDELNNINSNVAKIDIHQNGNVIEVTGDVNAVYNVLYELEYYDAYVELITLSLSDDVKNKAIQNAYDAALTTAKSNLTNIKEVKNITSSVVPISFKFDNPGNFSLQKQNVFSVLNEGNMKVKAISVIEVKS
ncbi:tetratricopeptide repeat protein [Methanobrevibacter sp.]|uniref:tetratricopeptide repeat protein n=1 Tax=Methanobrevibacter sp. TaxID=66852 RepID=UPI0038642738